MSKTIPDLSSAQIANFKDCYSYWLASFDGTISHLVNMDIETTGIVSKKLAKRLIDLQLQIQKEGFGANAN